MAARFCWWTPRSPVSVIVGRKFCRASFFRPWRAFFAVFGFLQAEVVPEAKSDSVVERKLQNFIADRLGRDAAEEGVRR